MNFFKNLTTVEKFSYPIILFFVLNSIFLSWINLSYFEGYYVERSGLLKQFQPMGMMGIIILSLYRCWIFRNQKNTMFLMGTFFAALLFGFALGETLTWGQRIFEYPTPAFFMKYNSQGMPTIHNLVFGNIRVNKLVFGLILGIVVGIYTLFGTFFYKADSKFGKFVDSFGIPLARWHHIFFLASCFALSKFVHSGKKNEVVQFAAISVFFLIFINPLNKANFITKK